MLQLSSTSKDLHLEAIPTKEFDNNGLLKQFQDVYSIIENLNYTLLSTSDQSIIEALSTRVQGVQDMKGALIDVKLRSEVKNCIFIESNIWDNGIAGFYSNYNTWQSSIETCDLNRSMHFFCNSSTCIQMKECTNLGICEDPKTLHVFEDGTAGLGLKTTVDIKQGSHVVEYVGIVITGETQPEGPYMMHGIESVIVNGAFLKFTINAETFGNKSRFCQHSCQPNMHAAMYFDSKGNPRVMLDSIQNITAGEPLTFHYHECTFQCVCPSCLLTEAVDFMTDSESVADVSAAVVAAEIFSPVLVSLQNPNQDTAMDPVKGIMGGAALSSVEDSAAAVPRIGDDMTYEMCLSIIQNKWGKVTTNLIGSSLDKRINISLSGFLTRVYNYSENLDLGEKSNIPNTSCIALQEFLAKVYYFEENSKALIREYFVEKSSDLELYISDDHSNYGLTNSNGGCGSYAIGSIVLKTLLNKSCYEMDTHLNLDDPRTREYLIRLYKCVLVYLPVRDIHDGTSMSEIAELKMNLSALVSFLECYQYSVDYSLPSKYWMNVNHIQMIASSVNEILRIANTGNLMNLVLLQMNPATVDFYQIAETTCSVQHKRNRTRLRSYKEWGLELNKAQFMTINGGHYFQSQHQLDDSSSGFFGGSFRSLEEPVNDLVNKLFDRIEEIFFEPPATAAPVSEKVIENNSYMYRETLQESHLLDAIRTLEYVYGVKVQRNELNIPRSLGNTCDDARNVCWMISCTYLLANSETVRSILLDDNGTIASTSTFVNKPAYHGIRKFSPSNLTGVEFATFAEAYYTLLNEVQKGRTSPSVCIGIGYVMKAFLKDLTHNRYVKNKMYTSVEGIVDIFELCPQIAKIFEFVLNLGLFCFSCNTFLEAELHSRPETNCIYKIVTTTSSTLQNIETSFSFGTSATSSICCPICNKADHVHKRYYMQTPPSSLIIEHTPITSSGNQKSYAALEKSIEMRIQTLPKLIRICIGPNISGVAHDSNNLGPKYVYFRMESVSHHWANHYTTEIKCGDGINHLTSLILNDGEIEKPFLKNCRPVLIVYNIDSSSSVENIEHEYAETIELDDLCSRKIDVDMKTAEDECLAEDVKKVESAQKRYKINCFSKSRVAYLICIFILNIDRK